MCLHYGVSYIGTEEEFNKDLIETFFSSETSR